MPKGRNGPRQLAAWIDSNHLAIAYPGDSINEYGVMVVINEEAESKARAFKKRGRLVKLSDDGFFPLGKAEG